MAGTKNNPHPPSHVMTPAICIELRPTDEHAMLLPRRRRAPQYLPPQVPLPRQGEVIYLSSSSAWAVKGVLHEWLSPQQLHVTVLIEYQGQTHYTSRPDFAVTQ